MFIVRSTSTIIYDPVKPFFPSVADMLPLLKENLRRNSTKFIHFRQIILEAKGRASGGHGRTVGQCRCDRNAQTRKLFRPTLVTIQSTFETCYTFSLVFNTTRSAREKNAHMGTKWNWKYSVEFGNQWKSLLHCTRSIRRSSGLATQQMPYKSWCRIYEVILLCDDDNIL